MSLAPSRRCESSTATGASLRQAIFRPSVDHDDRILGMTCAKHLEPGQFEHRLRGAPHGDLPRVSFTELAAHADQQKERKPAIGDERECVDAVADPAALDHQHRALAAEPGTTANADAFLLGGQHDSAILVAGVGALMKESSPASGR